MQTAKVKQWFKDARKSIKKLLSINIENKGLKNKVKLQLELTPLELKPIKFTPLYITKQKTLKTDKTS